MDEPYIDIISKYFYENNGFKTINDVKMIMDREMLDGLLNKNIDGNKVVFPSTWVDNLSTETFSNWKVTSKNERTYIYGTKKH